MNGQQNSIPALEMIRTRAAALKPDSAARLAGIRREEQREFARWRQQVMTAERSTSAMEAWRECVRSVQKQLELPVSREWLPAQDGQPRIAHIAEWLWEAGEDAWTEEHIVALVADCGQIMALTYAEIWLLPTALRLQALRRFMADTSALAEGEELDETDEEMCRRIRRVQRALALLDRLQWHRYLGRISRAEQCLTRDPGGVYPRMTENSRQLARQTVRQIALRSGANEETVAETALHLCAGGRFSDITQVLLLDRGVEALQDALQIPQRRKYRLHVDPDGQWIICGSFVLAILLFLLFAASAGRFWIALAGLPVFWKIARMAFNRVMAAIVPARPLPRMEMDAIPETMRTLVVIPARIAGEEELRVRLNELAACAALEKDTAVEFLLLADLPEAQHAHLPEDDVLLERSRRLVDDLNTAAEKGRFHVLWRERSFNAHDGLYQPKERKRGALMALYALLSGEQSAFLPHSEAQRLREGGFRYVITMDAGTMPYPGTFRQLMGAMAWPGNRFAVIQPCMYAAMRECPSEFERMFATEAGVSAYAAAAGNLYQDMTGRGIFGGKGIVDIAAFRLAMENRLPDDAVLSHDLIEGAITGAGFAGDIAWLEHAPATLRGSLSRFERWTRGDWQLLPFLLDRDQPLDGLSRFQMADNLLNPLAYVSALLMLIGSAWTGSLLAAIVPLAYIALPVLLNPANADSWRLKGLLAEICLLPISAWTALAAIIRALYRTYVSREHMLDWTTADDADRSGRVSRFPGVVAAILLLPVLAHPMLWPAMLALSGLFLLGADWLNLQQQPRREKPLSEADRSFLLELAKRTWRFFADNVNDQTNHLPPDNVQQNPPIGAAKRTSPTNIGMYLLSCLCAGHLGLIEREDVESRIGRTLDTLERMPKWRGHLYNWHDITDLKPLPPVMASSVDSGNLVGCLLCLAASDLPVSLRKRARNLAENTQLAALYDPERELFHVSADAAGDGLSEAHYDLFASESRILSLSAIALGQVPAAHWRRLGRETVSLESGRAHISWSGTMFEYLMPDLLFTAPEQSAWSESARTVTDLQMERAIDGMWGVSESGCAELDEEQQYGYRAFGLEEVSNSGRAQGGVIAPYAAALAMKYRREAAVETLHVMAERDYWTECGMIEAIDLRLGEPERVDSHMAHHQGMMLCALTNALCGDVLSKTVASLPEIRAISPLLQEKWQ